MIGSKFTITVPLAKEIMDYIQGCQSTHGTAVTWVKKHLCLLGRGISSYYRPSVYHLLRTELKANSMVSDDERETGKSIGTK